VASVILDRLLRHGSIINLRGESYRLKDKCRAGPLGSARISEIPKADSGGIPHPDQMEIVRYERFMKAIFPREIPKTPLYNFQPEFFGNSTPALTPTPFFIF
jgi:IstB-like ATP binding protein